MAKVNGTAIEIPPLEYTPVQEIPSKVATVRESFFQRKTRPIEFRKVVLRKLYWAIQDNKERIAEALARDLGKSAYEAFMTEIYFISGDILNILNNMDKWLKDEPASDIPLTWKATNPKIRKDPMGTVLIIGPSNYPFQLTLMPLFGAIAAGNTVVVKPSEITPNSSRIIQEIIESVLDPSCYVVVQGGPEETQALLAEKWDKIFFTGSPTVGRIVAKAAAVHLTPVVLELGGLNPAIVTRNADPRLVARRLLWAKSMNAGQTCTAHNYILIEKSIMPAVLEEFKKAYKDFYPNGSRGSPDYGRIVTDKAFQRLKAMLDNSRGKIIFGGTLDEKERYIEQTLVQVDSLDDSMIVNEAFGPIAAVYPVNDIDEAINIANKVQQTPLGVSVFGNDSDHEKVLQGTRSGNVSLNDAQPHVNTLAFGGVGESGMGQYRGRASVDVFLHHRPYTKTPGWVESMLNLRYPPYTPTKFKWLALGLGVSTPDFDRDGRKSSFTWLRLIFGGSPKVATSKAVAVAMVLFFVQRYLQRLVKQ